MKSTTRKIAALSLVGLMAIATTACSQDLGKGQLELSDEGSSTSVEGVTYHRVKFTNADGTVRELDCLYFNRNSYAGGPWCEEPKPANE